MNSVRGLSSRVCDFAVKGNPLSEGPGYTRAVIHLRSVSMTFPPSREVLAGVDLDVASGELVTVVGRSGVGKTTLLNVIGGLDTRYRGSVEVAGSRLDDLDDRGLSEFRSRTVGFVFQAYNLLEHLTVAENTSLAWLFARGRNGRRNRREAVGRALEVLEAVGLADRAAELPGALSGGERQRVAIARALFQRPPLLLCDEPTGNLDETTAARIAEVLQRVHGDGGVTVLLATHDSTLSDIADRVLELRDGALTTLRRSVGTAP